MLIYSDHKKVKANQETCCHYWIDLYDLSGNKYFYCTLCNLTNFEDNIRYNFSKNNTKNDIMVEKMHVIVKIWCDKRSRNTYHTVEIWINNNLLEKSTITYGHSTQYITTTYKLLRKNNYYNDNKILGIYAQDIVDKKIIFHTITVNRKKYL